MSRTYRNPIDSKGYRTKAFSLVRVEAEGVEEEQEELYTPSNRQKVLANPKSPMNPSRDDLKVAAWEEIPKSVRGW